MFALTIHPDYARVVRTPAAIINARVYATPTRVQHAQPISMPKPIAKPTFGKRGLTAR